MTIAAHITSDKKNKSSFLADHLQMLANKNSGDHFIFFTNKTYSATPSQANNITQVLVSPKIKNSILLHYWYNFKLPYLLKRYNATVFISDNNVLPLKMDIATIMVMQNVPKVKKINILQSKYKRYLQKYFPLFIKNTNKIICTENYLEQELVSKFDFTKSKISTIYPPLDTGYKPISWQQKEIVIKKYTDDKDYFLFPVSFITKENILPVLKAFSQFKKWQKSSMNLVLLSSQQEVPEIAAFNLYKYKDDVKIISTDDKKEIEKITAAAYAMIYLPNHEYIEYNALEAMQAEVPVIVLQNSITKNMYGDCAIFTSTNEKDISEKMIRLYKDEHLRNDIIKKGILQTGRYAADNFYTQFWETIININEGKII
jgi:glycosyltransferase involved in cell wall biosynthesis